MIPNLLIINGLVTLLLILNQNESAKDATSNTTNTEISNPLENITWFCVFFELILLLINSKITDL